MEKFDFLIVGAGFAGCTMAERLACELNKRVCIIDKRGHIGGNSYDYHDDAGVLVHKYGPHYFRTDNISVLAYLSKFTEWRPTIYKVKSYVDGRLYDFPINLNTINQFFNMNLSSKEEVMEFIESKRVKIDKCQNAEEIIISKIGIELYEKFYRNYTIKQWGLDPTQLDPSVTDRIPIRYDKDDRYFDAKYQAMPKYGYAELFKRMLNHHNIKLKLKTNYIDVKNKILHDNLIYTGCIDEFFGYKFGKLPYRSLKFEFETFDQEFYQNYSQINYPNEESFTRVVEIKHATGQKHPKTTIVREYPTDESEPYYPIPNKRNETLYLRYKSEADKLDNTYFVGRLAQYRYLNMDQVVNEALDIFQKIKQLKI